MMKRIFAMLLSAVMLLSVLPAQVLATEPHEHEMEATEQVDAVVEATAEPEAEEPAATEEVTVAQETIAPETEAAEELPASTEEIQEETLPVTETAVVTAEAMNTAEVDGWQKLSNYKYECWNMDGLKTLMSMSLPYGSQVHYTGSEITISENMTIPAKLDLLCGDELENQISIAIAEDATLTVNGEWHVFGDVTVNGTLINCGLIYVNGSVTTNGTLNNYGNINFYGKVQNNGIEHNYGDIVYNTACESLTEFTELMDAMAVKPGGYTCEVDVYLEEKNEVLDRYLRIPENVKFVRLDGDKSLTIAKGATLELDNTTTEFCVNVVVEGTLINNAKKLKLDEYIGIGFITFNEGSKYYGKGEISRYLDPFDKRTAKDFLPGADLSCFEVRRIYQDGWGTMTITPVYTTNIKATCTEGGYNETGLCWYGEFLDVTVAYSDALGHTGGEATCTTLRKCDRCNEYYGELNPAFHSGDIELRDVIPPSCTENGYSGDLYCLDCGAVTQYGEVLPVVHDYTDAQWQLEMEPTCSEPGSEYQSCILCGYRNYREIATIPHDFTDAKIQTVWDERPCDNGGVKVAVCNNCTFQNIVEYLPPVSCDYTAVDVYGNVGTPANCHSKAVCGWCKARYGSYDYNNHDGIREVEGYVEPGEMTPGWTGDGKCYSCKRYAYGKYIAPLSGVEKADEDDSVDYYIWTEAGLEKMLNATYGKKQI